MAHILYTALVTPQVSIGYPVHPILRHMAAFCMMNYATAEQPSQSICYRNFVIHVLLEKNIRLSCVAAQSASPPKQLCEDMMHQIVADLEPNMKGAELEQVLMYHVMHYNNMSKEELNKYEEVAFPVIVCTDAMLHEHAMEYQTVTVHDFDQVEHNVEEIELQPLFLSESEASHDDVLHFEDESNYQYGPVHGQIHLQSILKKTKPTRVVPMVEPTKNLQQAKERSTMQQQVETPLTTLHPQLEITPHLEEYHVPVEMKQYAPPLPPKRPVLAKPKHVSTAPIVKIPKTGITKVPASIKIEPQKQPIAKPTDPIQIEYYITNEQFFKNAEKYPVIAFYAMMHVIFLILGSLFGFLRMGFVIYGLSTNNGMYNVGLWYLHMFVTAAWYGQLLMIFSLIFVIVAFCVWNFGDSTFQVVNFRAQVSQVANNEVLVKILLSTVLCLLRPMDTSFQLFSCIAWLNWRILLQGTRASFTNAANVIALLVLMVLLINLVAMGNHIYFLVTVWDKKSWLHFVEFVPVYVDILVALMHAPWFAFATYYRMNGTTKDTQHEKDKFDFAKLNIPVH